VDFLPESGEDCRGSGEQDDETDPPEPHTGLRGEKTLTELAQQDDRPHPQASVSAQKVVA